MTTLVTIQTNLFPHNSGWQGGVEGERKEAKDAKKINKLINTAKLKHSTEQAASQAFAYKLGP